MRHATAPKPYQLTADGFGTYPPAIENTLIDRVDFAHLIKVYKASVAGEARYSPAEVVSTERVPVVGDPDPKRICTSHIERQNLTMRMQIRRLTRLTNGFSKKWENLWAALCLHFAWYNFYWIHGSSRVTPAMQAGIADRVWNLSEQLRLSFPQLTLFVRLNLRVCQGFYPQRQQHLAIFFYLSYSNN